MSIDPVGDSNLFIIGDVVHTVRQRSYGKTPQIDEKFVPFMNKGILKNCPISNYLKFIDSASRFIPDISDADYVGSSFCIKTTLANVDKTDTRPTIINQIDTKTITVFSEFVIHFYNAFSPNNDGKNDEFKPLGTFHLANSYKMMIYNRWGDLVFETDEPSVGWNGCKDNLIGVKQIQGLYSYVVHLTDHLGDKQKYVGQVVLLR